ncbi:hypothetical protein KJ742_04260 [Patescibacteria group bacterium]|nr:hypothetical protein [Patescibacteria group bacterium]MBU1683131.1 hypothetical protein [Patescibacteria group bacterium]MBU1934656.1 hypothetical protein [Patescibacteria group bacterium]
MTDTYKIAAIVGITEAIKQYGIPSKFCPTLAIIIGAIIGYAEKPDSQGILEGVILGATITGGYAVVKRGGQGLISPFQKSETVDLEPDDYRGV